MEDVTILMNNYRECSRNLWNTYFSLQEDWCRLDSLYEQIRKLLFEALVLAQIEEEAPQKSPVLKVVPVSSSMTIFIRRPSKDGNTYWDREHDMKVEESAISLEFIDYYDFFQEPVKDFRFYRCRVLKFSSHPEYEGSEALADVADSKVICDDPTEKSLPDAVIDPWTNVRF